jgi:anti-sigma B factor antagonist
MEFTEHKSDDILVLKIKGKIDSRTANVFQDKIAALIEGGEKQLVIDCSGLEYISSAGLRVLLWTTKKLDRNDGRVVLASLTDYVREVFDIAGFLAIFPVFSSCEEALDHCA